MKLTEKLVVMLIRMRNALSLLLIRIPMALPFILLEVAWCALSALLCIAMGDRKSAWDFIRVTGAMFEIGCGCIMLEFSAEKILKDYRNLNSLLNGEEP